MFPCPRPQNDRSKQLNRIAKLYEAFATDANHAAKQTAAFVQRLPEGFGVLHTQQTADVEAGRAIAHGLECYLADVELASRRQDADIWQAADGDLLTQFPRLQAELLGGGDIEDEYLAFAPWAALAVAVAFQPQIEQRPRLGNGLVGWALGLVEWVVVYGGLGQWGVAGGGWRSE